MSNPPQVSVWLDVPDDGRVERFVKLAYELLAVPVPDDHKAELPVLVT